MSGTKISVEVIRAAKRGESEAMQEIIRHYEPMIRALATKTCYDSDERPYKTIDDTLRDRLVSKLMIQIYYKYEIGKKTRKDDDSKNPESGL